MAAETYHLIEERKRVISPCSTFLLKLPRLGSPCSKSCLLLLEDKQRSFEVRGAEKTTSSNVCYVCIFLTSYWLQGTWRNWRHYILLVYWMRYHYFNTRVDPWGDLASQEFQKSNSLIVLGEHMTDWSKIVHIVCFCSEITQTQSGLYHRN